MHADLCNKAVLTVKYLLADKIGLKPGDIIVSAAGLPVKNVLDLQQVIHENAGKDSDRNHAGQQQENR